MRTQTLDRHLGFNKFAKGSHVKGHLNGLLFVIACPIEKDYSYPHFAQLLNSTKLKVKYVEDRVRTLVPSIPIHNFVDITNLKYGSTNEVGMQKGFIDEGALVQLRDNESSDAESTQILLDFLRQDLNQSDSRQIQFYVDLGSIYVDGGNELHYELSSLVDSFLDIEVYALSRENEPSHFISYDMDSDRNELHQNVVASYLCSPVEEETFANIDVTIDATSVQYESNTRGLLACSALFGKIENVSIGRTLPVFEAVDSLPEDVQVKFMSSENIVGYYVLNVRIDSSFKGYVDGKRKAITEKASVITQLEINQPDLAEILQIEGLPTSTELKERVL
jgi:hypothetical protein